MFAGWPCYTRCAAFWEAQHFGEWLHGYHAVVGMHLSSCLLCCLQCYTKQGLELTRVTVINSDLKVVYDTFVKPDTKVVDYNTR